MRLPQAEYQTSDNYSYTIDNQINYDVKKGKSTLNAVVLQESYNNVLETYDIAVKNLPYSSQWFSLGSSGNSNVTGINSSYTQNTLESFMGRVNYNYDEKYYLTLTGRGDGASQLSNGNKWAFFPSAAVAWSLGKESFIRDTKAFSNLKLRLSYGQVGNSNVAPYSTLANVVNNVYGINPTGAIGAAPSNLANTSLKWEKSEEFNLGLDMGFLNNRVTATLEVYNKTTKDLILQENLPTTTGFNSVYANVGEISNKGVELLLNTKNIITKNFRWSTTTTFSANKNRIEKLANGVTQDIGNSLFVGQPLHTLYDYKFNGIWQVSDKNLAATYGQLPGSVRVVDVNKDGVINDDDRQILGSELPKYTIGMTNYFTYKSFDLSFLIYYRNGTTFKNNLLTSTLGDYTGIEFNKIKLNYWTPNNPINTWYGPGIPQAYTDAIAYENANFLRVSDITIGYNLPQAKLDKFSISRCRIYAQVNNPFIFTKFHGIDPEFNSNTYNDGPSQILYTFGVNLTF